MRRWSISGFVWMSRLLLIWASCVASTLADNVTRDYYDEVGINHNRAYSNGEGSEYIDPFSGKLQFHYVDVFLPGNGGLDIAVKRSYTSRDSYGPRRTEYSPFGLGWTIHFGRIISRYPETECADIDPGWAHKHPILELSDGNHQVLYTPSKGAEFFGGQVPDYVTTELWKVDCISSTEGFVAYAPDGSRYEFSALIGATEPGVTPDSLRLRSWYVTKITDRNGNWLEFSYRLGSDEFSTERLYPLLETVTASDSRTVQFRYAGAGTHTPRLSTVTAYDQTWSYNYTGSAISGYYQLESVGRPDQSRWQYKYHGSEETGAYSISDVIHPHGGITQYEYTENFFNADGIKTISVEKKHVLDQFGVTPGTWTYHYEPGAYSSVSSTLDKTTIVGPDKTLAYFHYGLSNLLANLGEGHTWHIGDLKQRLVCPSYVSDCTEATALEIESLDRQCFVLSNDYVNSPRLLVTHEKAGRCVIRTREIQRSDKSFTTLVSEIDEYGFPIEQAEAGNAIRRQKMSYDHKLDGWILGLVERETTTLESDQLTEGLTTETVWIYDSSGNLESETVDGVQTVFTYHDTGDLETNTNARGITTQYLDYKRGTAQSVNYAAGQGDGYSVSRGVNNTGAIAWFRNGRGYTTAYQYDALNRVTAIDYPIQSSVEIVWTNRMSTLTRGRYKEVREFDGFGRTVRTTWSDTSLPDTTVAKVVEYDAAGRKLFDSNPNQSSSGDTYSYDALDRLTGVEHADGTSQTISYPNPFKKRVEDEQGRATIYTYRRFGAPDEGEFTLIEAPEKIAVSVERDVRGSARRIAQGEISGNMGLSGFPNRDLADFQ